MFASVRPADINPLPFAGTVASSLGWIAYAFVAQNRFLVCGSYISLLLGLFFTFSAYGYADHAVRLHRLPACLAVLPGHPQEECWPAEEA